MAELPRGFPAPLMGVDGGDGPDRWGRGSPVSECERERVGGLARAGLVGPVRVGSAQLGPFPFFFCSFSFLFLFSVFFF